MRHDRKGIPKELKSANDREEKSVLYVYHEEKNVMFVSCIDKEKQGKKKVIFLTTLQDKVKVTNDQQKKRYIHIMYDHTKGGVDIADLLSINHSTRIKSKRWPLNALSLVLDTCRTNAKTICGETTLKLTILSLTMSLEKLLSSQAFNDDLKIQRSSDQNPQQNGTCFSYPRSKPLPTS